MKSILVALDGSAASKAALGEAVAWSKRLNAELRGIYIEDESRFVYYPAAFSAEGGVPVAAPLADADLAKETQKVQQEAQEMRTLFQKQASGGGMGSSFIQERGNVNDLLTHEARGAELIVMGRRGHTTPSGSTDTGPTTETLIHSALRPVLVVPEKAQSEGGVLLAYDGSPAALRILPTAARMAQALGKGITVLCVGGDAANQTEVRHLVQRLLSPHGLEPIFRFSPKAGRIGAMIVDQARKDAAGLIAMGAFGHNPIRELIFGSTTLEVLSQSTHPVLLMA